MLLLSRYASQTVDQDDGVTFTGSGRLGARSGSSCGGTWSSAEHSDANRPNFAAEQTRCEPDSSHILSGFAAHCHPSL